MSADIDYNKLLELDGKPIKKKKSERKKGDGIKRPGMVDLGDYVEYQYVPQILSKAHLIKFNQPGYSWKQNECLIFLAFRTGRRPDELVNVRVMDFDKEQCMINWHILKKRKVLGHSERIPVDDETAEYLKEYIEEMGLKPEHYFFSWYKYGRVNPNSYTHMNRRRAWFIIRMAAELANVKCQNQKPVTPRRIRHSFAVHLAKQGTPLNVIKDLLCHSDIATTAIYAQFSKKDLRNQLKDKF